MLNKIFAAIQNIKISDDSYQLHSHGDYHMLTVFGSVNGEPYIPLNINSHNENFELWLDTIIEYGVVSPPLSEAEILETNGVEL